MVRLLILLGLLTAPGCATYEDQLQASERCREYNPRSLMSGPDYYPACDDSPRRARVDCGCDK